MADLFENILAQLPSPDGEGPLDLFRAEAARTALSRGVPNRKSEAWRYADIGWLAGGDWSLAKDLTGDVATPPLPLLHGAAQVVLQDMASIPILSDGVLLEALPSHLAGPDAWPSGATDLGDNGIAALNGAAFDAGVFLRTPAEAECVVELITSPSGCGSNVAMHRHLLHLGAGSHVTLIERNMPAERDFWTNSVIAAILDEAACLTHIRILDAGEGGIETAALQVELAAGAKYKLVTIAASGRTLRQDLTVDMAGEGADFRMDVLSLAGENAVRDIVSRVNHNAPNCTSGQRVRSVLGAAARANYLGTVHVAEGAAGTDASQSSKAIMLAPTAEANTKPELLIYADDVKCAHGATVGELDEAALFYLMSRGISPSEARALLVEAFVAALVDDIKLEEVRDHVADLVKACVPGAGEAL